MKKKTLIILGIVLLLVCGGGIAAYTVLTSPQYAMKTILDDVKKDGYEGLKPHLTGDALETAETIEMLTDNDLAGFLIQTAASTEEMQAFFAELDKVKWELGDIVREDGQAKVPVSFDYENTVTGTVELTMVKEGTQWKISGYSIEKLEFPQAEE